MQVTETESLCWVIHLIFSCDGACGLIGPVGLLGGDTVVPLGTCATPGKHGDTCTEPVPSLYLQQGEVVATCIGHDEGSGNQRNTGQLGFLVQYGYGHPPVDSTGTV